MGLQNRNVVAAAAEADRNPQPGLVVDQLHVAAVKPRDRADQGEAESASLGRARLFQPAVFGHRILAQLGGDARAAVCDRQPDEIAVLRSAQPDLAALARIFERIVDEIGDGPADQLAVAEESDAPRILYFERHA